MAERNVTLAEIFAASPQAFAQMQVPRDATQAVADDVGGGDAVKASGFAMADMLQGLYQALNLPLEDILRTGWASLVELQEYRDQAKHPPGEVNSLRFGKHKITSKHRPIVQVLLNDQEIASLTFDMAVTLHITATTLMIRDGSIWQARGSEVRGEGAVAYKGFTLARAKTRDLQLPGQIDFEEGIPIPPLPRAVV